MNDQQQLVADLSRPENLPHAPEYVESLSTHGSHVFRTPRDVWKVKRPRDYGFFDYTTLAARAHFCAEEVRLNRRGAPDVYLGVVPVWRDARGYSLNRPGSPGTEADWAVHMRALPDAASALSRVRAGTLDHALLAQLAVRLARFHREAAPAPPAVEALAASLHENFEQLAPFAAAPPAPATGAPAAGAAPGEPLLDAATLREVQSLQTAWFERHAGQLARRPACDGHGDLRLEHVYFLPEGPTLIDCIEFLDRFRIADPALDVAFLAMDLRREGRADLAEYLLARRAFEADDLPSYALIDGYMSYRALVRAKVACFVAADRDTAAATRARKTAEARTFLALARRLLAERPCAPLTGSGRPLLLGIGGLIASGKTTLADALVEALSIPAISADATRKALAGLAHEERGGAGLYTPEFGARVQDELLALADTVLASGRAALLDTTFTTRALRERVRVHAGQRGAAFLLVECRVPEAVARERLRARTGGLSDAREDLLDRFLAGSEPVTELPPPAHLPLDTTAPVAELVAAVRARLAQL